MTVKLIKDYKRGKVSVFTAHVNSPRLTCRGVDVPSAVPVYAEFNTARKIGVAQLVVDPDGSIHALFEMSTAARLEFGKNPPVILAFAGYENVEENGVHYIQGGTIIAASVLKQKDYENLYRKEPEPC